MEEPIFQSRLFDTKQMQWSGVLLALGLLCLVLYGVVFFADPRDMDRILGSFKAYYLLIIAGVCFAPFIYLRATSKIVLSVFKDGKGFKVTLLEQGKTSITAQPGFVTEGVWYMRDSGRGIKNKELYLTFFEGETRLFTLKTMILDVDPEPENFRFIDLRKINVSSGEGMPKMSRHKFDCKQLLALNELLQQKEDNSLKADQDVK